MNQLNEKAKEQKRRIHSIEEGLIKLDWLGHRVRNEQGDSLLEIDEGMTYYLEIEAQIPVIIRMMREVNRAIQEGASTIQQLEKGTCEDPTIIDATKQTLNQSLQQMIQEQEAYMTGKSIPILLHYWDSISNHPLFSVHKQV